MLTVNFTPFRDLTTDRLTLRRYNDTDINEIFFLRSDESVMKYIDRPRAQTHEDIRTFLQKVNDNISSGNGVNWGLYPKDENKLIGMIGYHVLDKENYRAEIGYVMHPAYYGKGLMHEAAKAVINYGFEQMGLHSIEAHINPENGASARVLERHGFIREAYFKENYYWNGKFLDSAVYSLITHVTS